MRWGVPLLGDRVAPRCTGADGLLLARVSHGRVVSHTRVTVAVRSPVELLDAVIEEGVEKLVCGGVSRDVREALASQGVAIVENVACSVDEVLAALDAAPSVPATAGHGAAPGGAPLGRSARTGTGSRGPPRLPGLRESSVPGWAIVCPGAPSRDGSPLAEELWQPAGGRDRHRARGRTYAVPRGGARLLLSRDALPAGRPRLLRGPARALADPRRRLAPLLRGGAGVVQGRGRGRRRHRHRAVQPAGSGGRPQRRSHRHQRGGRALHRRRLRLRPGE